MFSLDTPFILSLDSQDNHLERQNFEKEGVVV